MLLLQVQDTFGNSGNMNFVTSGNKKVAVAAIDRIQAGGGTNLSAGLFRAIDHHQQHTLLDAETEDTSTSRAQNAYSHYAADIAVAAAILYARWKMQI